MVLHIDTKDQKKVVVSLRQDQGGKVVRSLSEDRKYGSQVLLSLITKLLYLKKMSFEDLDEIRVETGPGSFTGLRVGVSVANALGYSLGIPVNKKKLETELVY